MDIIERLRLAVTQAGSMHGWATLCRDAADEIERLRKWQAEACDELVQRSRYAFDTDDMVRLLDAAGYEKPGWLT